MFLACASAPRAVGAPAPEIGSDLRDDAWVEETLSRLTPRERVAQLVMVWMSGGYASRTNQEFVRVAELVREQKIGGIVISLGTPLGYASRLNRLQDMAEVPLLVGADFEAGAGYRVGGVFALPNLLEMGGATTLPATMAFGAADDEALAYEAGRITGIEARALGVHLTFSPVLDVNNNPDNPIINTRSYGEDPERVAALGAAYIRGARAAGLMTTAKHFPGHGDTGVDSHIALPIIPGDRDRLDAVELVPFRRAIEAGVDAVMTAHVAAPEIVGPNAAPATLSPEFMTRILREDLGFDGLLITDALDMGAIVEGYGAEEAAVLALEAGADVLLMPEDPARAIEAVVAALESGRLTQERIDASVRRILDLKAQAGLEEGARVEADALPDHVATEAHLSFADSVARRSITLVRDHADAVPFDTMQTQRVLTLTFAGRRNLEAGRIFDATLGGALSLRRAAIGPETADARYAELESVADSVDAVVLSAYVAPGAVSDSSDLPGPLRAFVDRVEARGTPVTLVSFGSPYLLRDLPDASAYLLAWGRAESSQRAAANALLGRAAVEGRLPISLPPRHRRGEGITRRDGPPRHRDRVRQPYEAIPSAVGLDAGTLGRVDRLIESAIERGATPGAAVVVVRRGRVVLQRAYGRVDWAEDAPAVTDSTLYDLASLTKVIVTTTAVMQLVDDGRLSLDTRIAEHLPEWDAGWKREVTVEDLLLHRGGLPPFRPFWRDLTGRAAYRDAIAALEAGDPPGTRTVYSDIGLMTLQFVVETVSGESLDRFAARRLFEPLDMADTGFNPTGALRGRAAPTEIDTVFRGRHVVGEVHDENAFALGGVAGHAGLFSSARDLARFTTWALAAARVGRGLESRPPALASPTPSTVAAFSARADSTSSRALGWDTPSGRSSSGRFFGGDAFGHTGFTGTSIWIDPELDVAVVLLTNRVNPTRANTGHIPLRRAVHDAVAGAIRDRQVEPRR